MITIDHDVGGELAPLSMGELRASVYDTNRGEAIDFFAGLGGLTAAFMLAGGRVVHAANHWSKAFHAHASNFGMVEHALGDLSVLDPKRLRRGVANILVCAPECRRHSRASNWSQAVMELAPYDPRRETERSRATMWCPQRWASAHKFEHVVVENVVEIKDWNQFGAWCREWDKLGYHVQCASVNSAFFFAPQSRDRVAIVATRKGLPVPNLEFRPVSYCWECQGDTFGIQTWKRAALRNAGPLGPIGKYGPSGQYLMRCPACENTVSPYVVPAIAALDPTIEATRICDRKTPLKPKTIDRIAGGLARLGQVSQLVVVDGRDGKRSRPAWLPAMTQTGRQEIAVFGPQLIVPLRRNTVCRETTEPAPAVCAGGQHHAIVGPDQRGAIARDADVDPAATVTAAGNTFVAAAPIVGANRDRSVPRDSREDPAPVVTAGASGGLFMVGGGREHNVPRDAEQEPAATVTAAHSGGGLFFVGGMRDTNKPRDAEAEPAATVTGGAGGGGLFVIGANRTNNQPRPADTGPAPVVTTAEGGGLFAVEPPAGMFVQVGGNTFERKGPGSIRTSSLNAPAPTQSATPERAVVHVAPVAANGFAVTHEAYLAAYNGRGDNVRAVTDPAGTQTANDRHALLIPAGGTRQQQTVDADLEPAPTRMPRDTYATVSADGRPIDIGECTFRMLVVREAQALMDAVWLPDGSPWKLTELNDSGSSVRITNSDGVRLSGNAVCQTTFANVIHRVFCAGEGRAHPRDLTAA